MRPSSKSQIRRLVIQEYYRTKLVEQLYEQAAPAPADPTAPAPADPAAAAAVPADPAAAAAPTPIPAASAPAASAPAPAPAPAAPAPAPAPAVPTAATAGAAAKKAAKAPDPDKDPIKSKLRKAFDKSRAQSEDEVATESLRRKSLKFLVEQDDKKPQIDLGTYADEIANLIKNYTSLIDIKKNVITQAEQYLDDEFPKEAESLKKQLKNLLRRDYHISLERPEPPSDSYAVGAKSGGGAAA